MYLIKRDECIHFEDTVSEHVLYVQDLLDGVRSLYIVKI